MDSEALDHVEADLPPSLAIADLVAGVPIIGSMGPDINLTPHPDDADPLDDYVDW